MTRKIIDIKILAIPLIAGILIFGTFSVQNSYSDLGNTSITVTNIAGDLFGIVVSDPDGMSFIIIDGELFSANCPGFSNLSYANEFVFPVTVRVVDCGTPAEDSTWSVESDGTATCVSGTCALDNDGDGVTVGDGDPDDNDPCNPSTTVPACLAITDNDNDGTTADTDPDDNDPCNPDSNSEACLALDTQCNGEDATIYKKEPGNINSNTFVVDGVDVEMVRWDKDKSGMFEANEGWIITGTGNKKAPADDVVIGTGLDDLIKPGWGVDTVCARAGNDLIQGGWGNDTLLGEDGDDDEAQGGHGIDTCDAETQSKCEA